MTANLKTIENSIKSKMLIARPIIKKIFEDEPAIYNLIKKQRMIIMGFAFKSINSKNVNFNFSHKQEIRFP
jgi:hypothetical protein